VGHHRRSHRGNHSRNHRGNHRGIYAAFFPLLQGTTHTASGRGIHIDEKGLPHKQPETETTPAGVCSGGGEIVKSDLPDSPSVICSLPCSALPGTPGAVNGRPIHADGGPDHRPHGFHSMAKILNKMIVLFLFFHYIVNNIKHMLHNPSLIL